MLESLEHSNIKRMSLESPESAETGWFDVENEITGDDMAEIRNELESLKSNDEWRVYSHMASSLKSLGLGFDGLTDNEVQFVLGALKRIKENDAQVSHAMILADIKILNIDVVITPEDEANIRHQLNREKKPGRWGTYTRMVSQMKSLGWAIEIPPEALAGMKEVKEEMEFWRRPGMYVLFAEYAVYLKSLGLDISLTTSDREGMREALSHLREVRDWGNFVRLAGYMKMLSNTAPVELNMTVKPGPMPQQRSF